MSPTVSIRLQSLTSIHCFPPRATEGDPILISPDTLLVHALCAAAASAGEVNVPPNSVLMSAISSGYDHSSCYVLDQTHAR